ncbi:unnamed protein product [Cyclocybe aegerita]|uniref:Uncharacterized protein n=1 Tax=Cyclocybe aegerita TaxID=1973307 RepID=A0A8S0WG34_CYCAE|nr:unnamed protein product [Cyclocybe aegerita]
MASTASPRFPFSLPGSGSKKKSTTHPSREGDEWYIPYNGPVEPPPPKKSARRRDSWGDVVDEYGEGGVAKGKEDGRRGEGEGKQGGKESRDEYWDRDRDGYRESKERFRDGLGYREDDLDDRERTQGPRCTYSGRRRRAREQRPRRRTLLPSTLVLALLARLRLEPERQRRLARAPLRTPAHAHPVWRVGRVAPHDVVWRDRPFTADVLRRHTVIYAATVDCVLGCSGVGGLKAQRSMTAISSGYGSSVGPTNGNGNSNSNSHSHSHSHSNSLSYTTSQNQSPQPQHQSSQPQPQLQHQLRNQPSNPTSNAAALSLAQAERFSAATNTTSTTTDEDYYNSYYATLLHRPGSERVPLSQIPDVHPYQQLAPGVGPGVGGGMGGTEPSIQDSPYSDSSERRLLPNQNRSGHRYNTSSGTSNSGGAAAANVNMKGAIARRDFAYMGGAGALVGVGVGALAVGGPGGAGGREGGVAGGVSRANSTSTSNTASTTSASASGSGTGTSHGRGLVMTTASQQTQGHPYASAYAFPSQTRDDPYSPHTPHSAPIIHTPHSLDGVPRLTISPVDASNPHPNSSHLTQRRQPASADAAHHTFSSVFSSLSPRSHTSRLNSQGRLGGFATGGLVGGLGLGLGRYLKSSSSTPNLRESVIAIDAAEAARAGQESAGVDGPPPYASPTTWAHAHGAGGGGAEVDPPPSGHPYTTATPAMNQREEPAAIATTHLSVPPQKQPATVPPPFVPPKGLDKWLSAETWCDAVLFPRPRLRLKHELLTSSSSFGDGHGYNRITDAPPTINVPLTGSGRIRETREIVGREGKENKERDGKEGRDVKEKEAREEGKEKDGKEAGTTRPAPIRPPRPKSFAMDDLALPSPVPSLAHMASPGARLVREQARAQRLAHAC